MNLPRVHGIQPLTWHEHGPGRSASVIVDMARNLSPDQIVNVLGDDAGNLLIDMLYEAREMGLDMPCRRKLEKALGVAFSR